MLNRHLVDVLLFGRVVVLGLGTMPTLANPNGSFGASQGNYRGASAVDISSEDVTISGNYAEGLYITGAGNVVLECSDGSTPTIQVAALSILPIRFKKVVRAGTTATGLLALW